MQEKGFIHLYTGNGKGKTTAAIGQAIRASGAGMKIFMAQFVKGMHYSELETLALIPQIKIVQYGLECFIINKPGPKDIEYAQKGFQESAKIIENNEFDIVILDEICIALYYHLIDLNELIHLLKNKPETLEIIMTGRYASLELIEIADLVTEMKEIKHYYQKGTEARKGIEF
jgi:cob(I)alamin adenosyltransferase